MTNPDGVVVEFGSSDLKALLTYAYSKLLIRPQDSAGRRCEEQGFVDDNCNDDLPPDLFHIALANKIALRGQSIIADIDRYQEVWNHPLISYEAKIEKMVSKKKGRHAVITNRISYVDVLETSTWETHVPVIGHMTVKYSIELDEKGNIVSGEWLSRERPDFIWTIQRPEKFDDYLNGIFELLE